jgi:glycosyltransferase involved in cell wall biosynthesis
VSAARVSVVVPTRNRRPLLERVLGTILAQDVELDVVVVDDASDDDTAAWLANLGEERVTHVRNAARLGVAATRNVGVEHADAPWIAFVDDDDLWSPAKLSAQLAAAVDDGAAWALAGAVVLDRELRVRAAQRVVPRERFLPLLLAHNVVPGGASGVLARTELVREVGAFDPELRIMADWDLWIRLALRDLPARVQRPLVGYVLHGANMTSEPAGFRRELDRVRGKYAAERERLGVELSDAAWSEWLSEVQRRGGARLAPAREQLRLAVAHRKPRAVARAASIALRPGWLEQRDAWRLERIEPAWLEEADAWLAPLRAPEVQAAG